MRNLVRNNNRSLSLLEDLFDMSDSMFEKINLPSPKMNHSETENEYLMEIALPGMTKEDVSIELDGDILTISSESEKTSENSWYHQSFSKTFNLNELVNKDKISSSMSDGILRIVLPKMVTKKAEKKNIQIK